MKGGVFVLVLAALGAGCGVVVPPDCSQERAQPPARKQTLAFLSTVDGLVRTYEVQPSGCWTALDVDEGLAQAQSLSVHPGGRFLYESGRLNATTTVIRSFAIDPVRGGLAKLEDASLGYASFLPPRDVLAAETALYAPTGDTGRGSLHNFFLHWPLDPASGRLGPVESADGTTRTAGPLAWAPLRAALYFYSEDLGSYDAPLMGLRADHIAGDGSLQPLHDVGTDWGQPQVDPLGRFLWFGTGDANPFFPVLDVYRIGPDGALSLLRRVPWSRLLPVAHPSGQVVYGLGPDQLESYHVDEATGTPVLVATVPWRYGPARLAADPGGSWLYAIGETQVRAYGIDAEGRLIDRGRVLDAGGVGVAFTRVP